MVCLRSERIVKGRATPLDVSVIYNPSTGEFLTLPETKTTKTTRDLSFRWRSYLGYDPVKKQHKVLSMAYMKQHEKKYQKYEKCVEFQVLSLGTGKLTWNVVESCISHFPPEARSEICINGVLYYRAEVKDSSGVTMSVVSFDFRSEKFNVLKFMESFTLSDTTALVNYNGKLGVLMTDEYGGFVTRRSTCFELWILEDLVKHEWSKHMYELPPLWKNVGHDGLHFDGMIGTDEIVLLSSGVDDVPYVLYYNIKRKMIVRVEIKGIKPFMVEGFHIFLNHVENVKLIQA
ncbi:PREDICTED: putative F-box protein At3g23960 [Camelina sativa]|uniref:F-box protein At3g23960 n=1 Tax=Camelina sativa TaxID=90675 RepID=A0ABM0T758_CAMSA|nr:PREDICTED: putative F-box protein At3g23960 [Camelina sativa]